MYLVIDLDLSHAVTINIPCVAASRTNYQHTQSSTRGIHLKDNSGIDAFDAKIWFQDSVVNDIVTTPVVDLWKLCTLLWTKIEENLRYKKWLHILSNLHKYIIFDTDRDFESVSLNLCCDYIMRHQINILPKELLFRFQHFCNLNQFFCHL